MARRPQLKFGTQLQTAEELKKQKTESLVDPLASTLGAYTQQVKKVGEGVSDKTKALQNTFSTTSLATPFSDVGVTSPGGFSVQPPTQSGQYLTQAQGPTSIEEALAFDTTGSNLLNIGQSTAQKSNIQGQGAKAESKVDEKASLESSYTTGGWKGVVENLTKLRPDLIPPGGKITPEIVNREFGTKFQENVTGLSEASRQLEESRSLTHDIEGNILGSNRTLGEMGKASADEINALNRASALSSGSPTQNVDALSAMLGASYDPELSKFSSQIYESDIAKTRGMSEESKRAMSQAKSLKGKSLEDYLNATTEAGKTIVKVKDDLAKGINTSAAALKGSIQTAVKAATDEIDRAVKQAEQDAPGTATTTFNKGIKQISQDLTAKADSIAGGLTSYKTLADFKNELKKQGKLTLAAEASIDAELQNVRNQSVKHIDTGFKAVEDAPLSTENEVASTRTSLNTLKESLEKSPFWDEKTVGRYNRLIRRIDEVEKAANIVKQGKAKQESEQAKKAAEKADFDRRVKEQREFNRKRAGVDLLTGAETTAKVMTDMNDRGMTRNISNAILGPVSTLAHKGSAEDVAAHTLDTVLLGPLGMITGGSVTKSVGKSLKRLFGK